MLKRLFGQKTTEKKSDSQAQLENLRHQLWQYGDQLDSIKAIDIDSFLQVVDVLQAEFNLYALIKRSQAGLAGESTEINQDIRDLITQLFGEVGTALAELHQVISTNPEWLELALTGAPADVRLEIWRSIADLANMAARVSALSPEIETDFWRLSDHWLLRLHELYGFEPGFSVGETGQILSSPVVIDWQAMAEGSYYWRPYARAISHADFPADRIYDANAVDILVPSGQVVAVSDGTIILRRFSSTAGGPDSSFIDKDNYIFVQDPATHLITAYRHLETLPTGHVMLYVTEVKAGQILDNVAMTGKTSEMHLHFAVYREDENGWHSLPLQLTDVSAQN